MKNKEFETLPWNGFAGAISLTFDDGDPSQLQIAIPEMVKRNIRGTFYLIANRLKDVELWKEAFKTGQELGNHTLDHKHAVSLNDQQAFEQVFNSKKMLEDTFGVPAITFAYPFTEITPALRKAAEHHHFLSRGGYGPVYFQPNEQPDWAYLASQVIYSHTSSGILKGWTDENIREHTWSLPQFHAFQGGTGGWQPLPPATFLDFLDDLVARKADIWTAPIGEIGAYWMAQNIVETAHSKKEKTDIVYRWKKPALLPSGTRLKAYCPKNKIHQNGKILDRDENGHYLIDFDAEEMTISSI